MKISRFEIVRSKAVAFSLLPHRLTLSKPAVYHWLWFTYGIHPKGEAKSTVLGWELPKPPVEKCPECGEQVRPVAYQDADGWALTGWDCDNYCNAVDDF